MESEVLENVVKELQDLSVLFRQSADRIHNLAQLLIPDDEDDEEPFH